MEAIVSIIIPTYNRGHLIEETLLSVQNQSFLQWECIIVDDGSTDNTKDVVEKFSNDKRFKYFSRNHFYTPGAGGCRNFGFKVSQGKYIQWLDDDDLLSNTKLEHQFTELELKNSNYVACCPWDYYWPGKIIDLENFFEDENRVDTETFFITLAKNQSFIPLHAYLIPRSICLKAGGWNEKLTLNDDAEYITRILVGSDGLLNVSRGSVLYRNHSEDRVSRKMNEDSLNSLLSSLELINSHIKSNGISVHEYFRWKLLKIFVNYWKSHKNLIRQHSTLFKQYGIDLKFSMYYQLKYSAYLHVYPLYKQLKNWRIK